MVRQAHQVISLSLTWFETFFQIVLLVANVIVTVDDKRGPGRVHDCGRLRLIFRQWATAVTIFYNSSLFNPALRVIMTRPLTAQLHCHMRIDFYYCTPITST